MSHVFFVFFILNFNPRHEEHRVRAFRGETYWICDIAVLLVYNTGRFTRYLRGITVLYFMYMLQG